MLEILFFASVFAAGPDTRGAPIPHKAPSHYCGLHCVYAAAQVHDVDFDFVEILRPEYLTGQHGSSAANLSAALSQVGLSGSYKGFLTIENLRLASQPIILHVRAPGLGPRHVHWVLFLGFEGDKVRLYDPPHDNGTLTTAELLSLWDGTGIVVGKEKSLVSIPVLGLTVLLCAAATVLIQFLGRWFQGYTLAALVSLTLALISHGLLETGFMRSQRALANVRSAFFVNSIPVIDLDETERMAGMGDCALVDARPTRAYARFHLPNAINIPISSSYIALTREISRIEPGKKVVVYCQNDRCGWAEAVAQQIVARSDHDVFVYQGGVSEWRTERETDD